MLSGRLTGGRADATLMEVPGAAVRSTHVRALLRGLAAVGLDAGAIAQASAVDPEMLGDPDAYVPAAAFHGLWKLAQQADGGRDLGLRVGSSVPSGAFELLDYMVASCTSVGHACEALVRFGQLGTTTSRFRIVSARAGAEIRVESMLHVPGVEIPDVNRDYVFSMISHRFVAAQPEFRLERLELRGPALADLSQYAEHFGCPVHFEHERSTIVLSRRTWKLPLVGQDAVLHRILVRHAEHLLDAIPPRDFVDLADHELARMLGTGRVDIATLATRLGTSVRTLQRRLEAQGVPYSMLLDRARCRLARAYLADPSLSVDDVSALLGYSEPSAFSRAFRRWTGVSPRDHRRRQRS